MNQSLSLKSANVLLLITMLLVISVGSLVQTANLSIGVIATELFLILIPALLFLRLRGVPFKKGLRLNPISPLTAILCVALGFSTFLFSAVIEGIMMQLTGMATVPISESMLPKSVIDSVLYFVALAIFAPLGEETLFRGAIQGAYQTHRSARFAILMTASMFAFYHFRLSGLPGLIPVALILSYVVWRTNSLYAGMLIHFGMNATSAANTLAYLQGSPNGLGVVSLWTALGGLMVTVAILIVIRVLHPLPLRPVEEAAQPEPRPSWISIYWPLFGAGLLYLGVVALTLFAASLGIGVTKELNYFPPKIEQPIASTYQITNRDGQAVGEMTCQITPQSSTFSLDCQRTIQAYEVASGNSYYKDDDNTTDWTATWDAQTLDLQAFRYERQSSNGYDYQAELSAGNLTLTSPEDTDILEVREPYLIEYEWAWRAAALQGNSGENFNAPFVKLLSYDEQLKRSHPEFSNQTLTSPPMKPWTCRPASLKPAK